MGASTWLYPQTDVFVDLADARERDGGDVRFAVTDTSVVDLTSDRPAMRFTDAAGVPREVRCEVLVGADGSRSTTRGHVTGRAEALPDLPLRLVRDPLRGTPERRGAWSTPAPSGASR
nr:FAD-dependent monooxygenase [Nocardioides convexus]